MSRKNVVDVTYILSFVFFFFFFFSTIFNISQSDAPIKLKLKIIFCHLLIDFAKCLPTCYVNQCLNMTYSPGVLHYIYMGYIGERDPKGYGHGFSAFWSEIGYRF